MRPDVVTACGHRESTLLVELHLRVERFLAHDEKIAFGHATSLPAQAD